VTGNIIRGGQIGYYSKAGTEDFSANEISGSYIGFFSSGAEEVHHNIIKNCHGDGMIMYGLRGRIHNNMIKYNAGSGVHVIRPEIDLGGGNFDGPGNNVITGNGNFDLYIDCMSAQNPVMFAKYNVWDHTDASEIRQYDIWDGSDSTGLVTVDFTPFAYLGTEEAGGQEYRGKEAVEVFPNPTHGKFQITSTKNQANDKFQAPSTKHQTNSKNQIQNIEVVDLYGEVIKPNINRTMEQWNSGTLELDISTWPAGIYFIRISLENQIIVKKIIKL